MWETKLKLFHYNTMHSSNIHLIKLKWYNFETVQKNRNTKWAFRICKKTSVLILFFSLFPRAVILMEESTKGLKTWTIQFKQQHQLCTAWIQRYHLKQVLWISSLPSLIYRVSIVNPTVQPYDVEVAAAFWKV